MDEKLVCENPNLSGNCSGYVKSVYLRLPMRVNAFEHKPTRLCAACRKSMKGQWKYAPQKPMP